MKFKLISPIKENYQTIEQVLENRGISREQIPKYLNTTDEDINSPLAFGEEKMRAAASLLLKAIWDKKKILIVVDSDCDGMTSSALLINYLNHYFPYTVANHLTYFMHSGKQHGLSDCVDIAAQYDVVILPDSSSNDYEYHKQLADKGIGVLILDHHDAEKVSEDAIVINNQLSDYPNKFLSGVGVTWQFCRYLDTIIKDSYADKLLDLVALGLVADMMDARELETRHLISKGFKEENLNNPFIVGLAEKNEYSLGGKITPIGAAFYIAPFVNAICRSGEANEKEIVFNSMLAHKAFQKIPSTKRGHKIGEMESVLAQALRICTNVKNRQTREQDKGMELLEKMIESNNLLDNKVLLFLLNPGEIDTRIAGLIANKLMAKYQRPCCVLTKREESDGTISYQGSARGYDKSGVSNFKDICSAAGAMFAEGHQSAFGLGLYVGKKDYDEEVHGDSIYCFLEATNAALKDMASEPIYSVDYIFPETFTNVSTILDIARHDDLWGQCVDEPLVAIEKVKVTKDMVTLMSPDKKPVLKITLPNKVTLIKFNSSQEEYESFYSETGYKEFNFIGRCSANEWLGRVTPQILLVDWEQTSESKYVF